MGLIWISQILRVIEIEYSVIHQIFDIAIATIYALPSFIGPLMPFLILIASFFLNNKFNSFNEIIIIKQYLSKNIIFRINFISIILIFFIYLFNNEIISKNSYAKYKLKELDIRNNLKLGTPTNNDFHIDEIMSIFFKKKEDNIFYDVQAIIYPENQFINSKSVKIEPSKSHFNLVFEEGERLILDEIEKSKTLFDKFTYSLSSKESEILLMDKDHYNTFELLKHKEKDFKFHGHNNIFQYFFLFFVCLISLKIIFFYKNKKSHTLALAIVFFSILILQIFNSYLIYLLNNSNFFRLEFYYSIISVITISTYFFLKKLIQ